MDASAKPSFVLSAFKAATSFWFQRKGAKPQWREANGMNCQEAAQTAECAEYAEPEGTRGEAIHLTRFSIFKRTRTFVQILIFYTVNVLLVQVKFCRSERCWQRIRHREDADCSPALLMLAKPGLCLFEIDRGCRFRNLFKTHNLLNRILCAEVFYVSVSYRRFSLSASLPSRRPQRSRLRFKCQFPIRSTILASISRLGSV